MTCRKLMIVVAVAALAAGSLPACRSLEQDQATVAILAVMQDAQDGWNAGDLEAYMDSYWRSDELRFAGGDKVSLGWHQVLASYERGYPNRAAMGRLEFGHLDVDVLSADAAVVFGRWRLFRAEDQPHGLFTLLLRHIDGHWRIVHDHTSAAD